jgi:poly(A) polymerase Pap1/2'-5' RNA ligase/uncharacterized protein (UPF0248 family)/endonuclease/exonuclease/phosphatase family metal-dependent hydrolase
MAMATSLSSTQTALAIVAPTHLSAEIDTIRSLHDKAFGKWQPHINVLYPFVPLESLNDAIKIIRAAVLDDQAQRLRIEFDDIGVFRHRKNATVYLKPTIETDEPLQQLRNHLLSSLSSSGKFECKNGSEYNPHLTLGQVNLNNNGDLEYLDEKSRKLLTIDWEATHLVVLKRTSSGEMLSVEEIPLGSLDSQPKKLTNSTGENATSHRRSTPKSIASSSWRGWRNCYGIDEDSRWYSFAEDEQVQPKQSQFLISSFNLMIEDHAPPFEHRLPAIERFVAELIAPAADIPKVLCLQEVNAEMLSLIYGTPFFQENFPYSTHTPDSPMQSIRNQVVISSKPFRLFSLQYPQRNKSSLVAKFIHYDLAVVNIHLTSALTDEAVAIKKEQMEKLTNFLTRHDLLHETVLAGDFNVTTSSETIRTALEKGLVRSETIRDLQQVIDSSMWSDAFLSNQEELSDDDIEDIFPGEEGATFDRINNPLAAMSKAPIDNRPQRFDRILYTTIGSIKLSDYGRFAIPSTPDLSVSDHYGIFANVYAGEKKAISAQRGIPEREVHKMEDISVIEDVTDIHALIQPFLPSDRDRAQRTEALRILQSSLSREPTLADTVLAPLGSYAMDTYFANSDIDVLVIGSVAPRTFFDTIHSCLNTTDTAGVPSKVHLINSLVQIAETSVNGIKLDLQYCQAPELLQKYVRSSITLTYTNTISRYHSTSPAHNLEEILFDPTTISDLRPNSLRPLNTYRDTAHIIRTTTDMTSFREAHRFLTLYLRRSGLYSAKFGYLGGIHLSLTLNRIVKLLQDKAKATKATKLSSATIIRTFFSYYSSFDWANRMVVDPSKEGTTSLYKRTFKEPVVIRSIFTPTARPNVSESCSILSARTITSEFSLANAKLAEAHWKWCLRPQQESVSDFLNEADIFIRIKVDIWNVKHQTEDRIRDTIGLLESRMPGILVALGRIQEVQGRIWPAMFTSTDEISNTTDLSGYYLVSVSNRNENLEPDPDNKGLIHGKVLSASREYERLAQQSKLVDGTHAWVAVEVATKKKVWDMGLIIDPRNWTNLATGVVSQPTEAELNHVTGTIQTVHRYDHQNKPSESSSSQHGGSRKLRPVQDIISRIIWDEAFDENNYIIGYEDRFSGIMEIDLVNWKTEQTDLEFIPTHRIVWIRQKGDEGEKVWDRRTRYDALFHSGLRR